MLNIRHRRTAAVALAGAVIALGGLSAGPLAQAATPDRNVAHLTDNHVYIAIHGLPTYSTTVEFFDIDGNRIGDKQTDTWTQVPTSWSWNSGSMRIHIVGAWNETWATYEASSTSYDHCYLVDAGGSISDTGDNISGGCNGS
jgi:hypothetical protein